MASAVLSIAPEGNLSRYLQEIRRFPMLTPDEELDLARRRRGCGGFGMPDLPEVRSSLRSCRA
jgi:RNA polymerase sigma-32 factor